MLWGQLAWGSSSCRVLTHEPMSCGGENARRHDASAATPDDRYPAGHPRGGHTASVAGLGSLGRYSPPGLPLSRPAPLNSSLPLMGYAGPVALLLHLRESLELIGCSLRGAGFPGSRLTSCTRQAAWLLLQKSDQPASFGALSRLTYETLFSLLSTCTTQIELELNNSAYI